MKDDLDYDEMYEDDYDNYDDKEPDYYYCTCCNHAQTKPGMGNGCDNCGLFNVMEAEYF